MSTTFRLPISIYVEDTDFGGIVYHANHLKFMERVRTEWLLSLGFTLTEMEKTGFIFVVFKISIKYLQPMRLHDRVEATCTIAEMGKSSITFKQTIESPGGQQVYSESDVVLVCVDKTTMRPKYMPNFLREKLS